MSLPTRVRLPFGFVITVKVLGSTLRRKCGSSNVHGCWDVETRTIYVDKGLDERTQKYVFTHELIHALADFQHFVLGEVEDRGKV